jgi:hypothetical protein
MAYEASAEKRKNATLCAPSRAIRGAEGTESAAWQLWEFCKNIIVAVPEPRDQQLSAHFRKSKTRVGAFGKKMSVRQKSTWEASDQI